MVMVIVVVQVGRLGSQTPYPWRNQSGNLGYSTWRTEFKGDMAQRFIQTFSEIRLKLGLFVSTRRASARLFANLPATMI